MRILFYSLLVLVLTANIAFAKTLEDDADAATPGPEKCARLQASTVFVSDRWISRKKGSASKLTESHRKAEQQGWNFEELSVYIENSDLQGFWVTYTRPHPCNEK